MTDLKQAAYRVLAEQRESRNLKASTYRKRFGDRLTKDLEAEVKQMEEEVEAIDAIFAAIEEGKVF